MRCPGLVAVLFVASPIGAADKLPPELALIPPDAAAFVSVRVDRLIGPVAAKGPWFGEGKERGLLADFERSWVGFPSAEIERVTAVYPVVPAKGPGPVLPVFAVTRTKPIDRVAVIRKLEARPPGEGKEPAPKEPARRGDVWQLRDGSLLAFAGDRTIVLASRANLEPMLAVVRRRPDRDGEAPLGRALAAAAGDQNVLAAGATGPAFKALGGVWPARDRDFEALGRASAVAVVADLTPDLRATVRAEFANQVTAREGQAAMASLAGWAAAVLKEIASRPAKADADLGRLTLAALQGVGEPKREGKAVTATLRLRPDDLAALGRAATTRVQLSADRMTSSNNLKLMGLAVHNAHDTYGEFPFATRPKQLAHPGLSWRVAVLPFIGQDKLYAEFKLDEPWDSEHNKKLIDKMPRVYSPPRGVESKPGHTFYRMFDGPRTMSQVKTFADISDGASNTLMIVEAGEAVVWTKPDELTYDSEMPLPKLGGHFADGFHAALADGSVRFVRKTTHEDNLRAAITVDGAEILTLDKD